MLELPERTSRFDSQLVDQAVARSLVDTERLGLATRPVKRVHELRCKPLPVWMFASELVKPVDQTGSPAERELRLVLLLECAETKLFEPRPLLLEELSAGNVGKRGSAPERECLAQRCHCERRVAVSKG